MQRAANIIEGCLSTWRPSASDKLHSNMFLLKTNSLFEELKVSADVFSYCEMHFADFAFLTTATSRANDARTNQAGGFGKRRI